ncbi:hypothetical protein ACFLST_00035 [Chloroflexota bacterium]
MLRITKGGIGALILGVGTAVIGVFAPETGWIETDTAKLLTILGSCLFVIGLILIVFGLRSTPAESIEQKIDRLLERVPENQSNMANRSMDEAMGIKETATGESVLLVPIIVDDAKLDLGDVYRGSKQTYAGLDVDDSPILFKIPRLGYAMITIAFIGNDAIEVDFRLDIKIPSRHPVILTLTIGPHIAFSQHVPALQDGDFVQKSKKSKTGMNRQIRDEPGYMTLEIETGVT